MVDYTRHIAYRPAVRGCILSARNARRLHCSGPQENKTEVNNMEKYLTVKVGGEDCCKRTYERALTAHYCLINYADCPDPENCPHGYTKEELVAKISKEKELCRIDVNTVVSAILEEK